MNYEEAIKELQNSLVVITEVHRESTAILRQHNEILEEHNRHFAELQEYRRRTDQNLSEITDKLNGLIGYMDGLRPPPAA